MPTPAERDDQETQAALEASAGDGPADVAGVAPGELGDGRYEPYPDPDRPGLARVPVRTGKPERMEAVIDAADLPLVQGKRWGWMPGKPGGPGSVIWRMDRTRKPSLARVVLGAVDDSDRLACHLNGNPLDCRRENIVLRTRSEVRRASRKLTTLRGKACDSRFRGVSRTESGRKWAATIRSGERTWNIGRFRNEVDAALAYDAALRQLTGEDAPVGLNFPDPAEADRLRALEPVGEEAATWPPPGMVDRRGACAMLGVSLRTLTVWERLGRITCGQIRRFPNDKPGRCKLYPVEELGRARVEIERLGRPYPDPDRPGVWRVPLAAHRAQREALIEEADLPIVQGRNWNWSPRSDAGGRTDGVVVLATTGRSEPLHRLVAGVTDPKVRVAFLNGDALDCRRANLAVRTLAETAQTTRKMAARAGRGCKSRYKGVVWHADRGAWAATIRRGGVGLSLGRFATEDEAAAAYDAAARELFGPHAYLNFPDRPSTEQAKAAARAAFASGTERTRAQRRRQREMERHLRRAAAEMSTATDIVTAGETIPADTARQLFDVPTAVWQRWRRFGWLPAAIPTTHDGSTAYPVAAVERLLRRCGIVALPYPDPQRPGCYRVPLIGEMSRGMEALIDADAVPLVRGRRWMFDKSDARRKGEVRTPDPAENLRLHYVVMGMAADPRNVHLGHRNDDPLDCRRANLVVRSLTDSGAHKRKQATANGRPCTSRFKGVCWLRREERWLASITKDRRQTRLGTFRDELAAAQAYDEAARELFGEHARLNFPDGVDARLEREAAAAARAKAA